MTETEEELVRNTKQYNELGDPALRAMNVILCGVIMVGLWLVLDWANSAFLGLRYARLQHQFSEESQRTGASLSGLIDSRRFAPLFAGRSGLLKIVRPLFGMVEGGELTRALETLRHEEIPQHPFLVVLRKRLAEIASDDERFFQLQTETKYASALRPQLWARYVDLANRGAQLFEARTQFSAADDGLPFYTEGVLKGLPLISGIPDGIESVEQLAVLVPAFRRLSASERLQFLSEMEEYRTTGASLELQLRALDEKGTARTDELGKIEGRHKRVQRSANLLTRRFAAELTRQSLSVKISHRYDMLRALADRFAAIHLPDLAREELDASLSEEQVASVLDADLSEGKE